MIKRMWKALDRTPDWAFYLIMGVIGGIGYAALVMIIRGDWRYL